MEVFGFDYCERLEKGKLESLRQQVEVELGSGAASPRLDPPNAVRGPSLLAGNSSTLAEVAPADDTLPRLTSSGVEVMSGDAEPCSSTAVEFSETAARTVVGNADVQEACESGVALNLGGARQRTMARRTLENVPVITPETPLEIETMATVSAKVSNPHSHTYYEELAELFNRAFYRQQYGGV